MQAVRQGRPFLFVEWWSLIIYRGVGLKHLTEK